MKYYLIAGEASGDLHGSSLMAELQREDPGAGFRCLGGDLMQAAGGSLLKHYREMAFMGLGPVALHLRSILRTMQACRDDIRRYRPDALILIDYPGFNLKIARYAKTRLNLPVFYYISPKIWAWKQYRINAFRRYVDRMFCIFPFEPAFYQRLNYPVDYVGNPTVDSVAHYRRQAAAEAGAFLRNEGLPADKPLVALLAGSRRQEIKDNLPAMLKAASAYPAYQPVVAGAPGIEASYYDRFMPKGAGAARIVFNQTYALLHHSAAALVVSGTASLETALFRVPQAVCYRTPLPKLSGFIFRRFFHTPYISLTNLIAGREVTPELFADRFSEQAISAALGEILHSPACRERMLGGYDEVIRLLGSPGASRRTALHILSRLSGLNQS
jgi:lipid-A-disaccharide synthase